MASNSADYMREYRRRKGLTKSVTVPYALVQKAMDEVSWETRQELEAVLNGGRAGSPKPVEPKKCRNCGTQIPDTVPQYWFCFSECEREYNGG